MIQENQQQNICISKSTTVEPRVYDLRFNDIPDLTINLLCPGKRYSQLYGVESRYNNRNLATQA